jgi:hypothetical protein
VYSQARCMTPGGSSPGQLQCWSWR